MSTVTAPYPSVWWSVSRLWAAVLGWPLCSLFWHIIIFVDETATCVLQRRLILKHYIAMCTSARVTSFVCRRQHGLNVIDRNWRMSANVIANLLQTLGSQKRTRRGNVNHWRIHSLQLLIRGKRHCSTRAPDRLSQAVVGDMFIDYVTLIALQHSH